MNLIEELKEERLARRQNHKRDEKIKALKKRKRKRFGLILSIIGGFAILGVISGIIMYISFINSSSFNANNESAYATETPTETATQAPAVVIGADSATQQPSPDTDGPPIVSEPKPMGNSDGYIETSISGLSFAYPYSFSEDSSENGSIVVKDSSGATIKANKVITSLTPKDLLRKYADETGGQVVDSIADNNGYEVTISVGNDVCHKKSIVSGGAEIYYEIRYKADSPNGGKYAEYIEYMDEYFIAQ